MDMDRFILLEYIKEFRSSKERKRMLEGEAYYLNEVATKDLLHSFMSNMIDEKVQYLLGKEPTLKCEKDDCHKKLKELLGKDFLYNMQGLATEASNKGIAWSQVYINEFGNFDTMLIPSEQMCPIWKDRSHKELEGLLRIYDVETYKGTQKELVTHVEHYEDDGVTYYILEGEKLILDSEKYLDVDDNVKAGHYKLNGQEMAFGLIPFIWTKNNRHETTDLQLVKSLIDDYNSKRTEISEMLTDCKEYIYAIKNYGGDTDDDILSMIKEKRRIFIDDDGGVEILTPSIDITATETHYKQLKEDIQIFGKSVPRQQVELGSAPSGIALKFMYSGLDLKCNGLEAEMKFMFRRLVKLINAYLCITRDSIDEEVEIIFNRDITINEMDAITAAKDSMGIISQKTIAANHPWVTDLEVEMQQLEEEKPSLEEEYILGGEVDEK